MLRTIDWTIMIVYFVFVLGIGAVLKRYVKTSTDFFVAGRSIPAWVGAEIESDDAICLLASGRQQDHGERRARACRQRKSSRPSIPGSITSSTTRSAVCASSIARAVVPSPASSVACPSRSR